MKSDLGMTTDQKHMLQLDRLKKLIEANQALAELESLEDLLPRLLNLAQEVSLAQAASILLYKPETDTLEFTLAINDAAGGKVESILKESIELKMGEGIAGSVASDRTSILVENAQADDRWSFKADEATGFTTKSLICAPIMHKEELLGVVQVLNPKDKDFFDHEDLMLLESFGHLGAVAIVRSKLLEAVIQQERMQVQLETAARIQSHFLPKLPDMGQGHEIWAITKPAIFVGGDFYDCIDMNDGSYIVIVCDVSGKGLPAALVGATLLTSIRSLKALNLFPGALLEALNADMFRLTGQELFATMVVGRYWPDSGRVVFSLAGHVPPIVIRNGSAEYVGELHGPPLGVDPYSTYVESELNLGNQESFIFITDGVSEARNSERQFYGDEQVIEFLSQEAQPPLGQGLVEEIEKWLGPMDANDDITLLEVWRS